MKSLETNTNVTDRKKWKLSPLFDLFGTFPTDTKPPTLPHGEMAEFKIIVGCLSALVCMALVLVIFGQRQAVATHLQKEILRERNLQLYLQTIEDSKGTHQLLEIQLHKSLNEIKEHEEEVNKLVSVSGMKNTQIATCQADKVRETDP